MREIIFRGKRTDNGEWVEGYLTRRPSAIQYGAHYSPWFIDTPPSDPDDSGSFNNVERETVGQFTGLSDKNGTRIFEGDIVEYREERGEIVYSTEEARFMVEFDTWCTDFDHLYGHEVEVVGNIHGNPEMLENKEGGGEEQSLKNCVFCGSSLVFIRECFGYFDNKKRYDVICRCGVAIPPCEKKSEAIRKWNSRMEGKE